MSKSILFSVEGGLGKCIAATAVLRAIRKKYPKNEIIVISPHPCVFRHNPYANHVWRSGTDVYSRIMEREEFVVLKIEPYNNFEYMTKRKHLTEVWCEMVEVPYDGKKPDLYLSVREKSEAEEFANQFSKPIMFLQITGGGEPQENTIAAYRKSLEPFQKRDLDLDVAKQVVRACKELYDVVQIKTVNQPGVAGAKMLTAKEIRFLFAIIPHAEKFLVTDSFMQHATAAFDKAAVACWCGTSPVVLGHDLHTHIRHEVCETPECMRPFTSLSDFTSEGVQWECPVGEICRKHSAEKILDALGVEKQKDRWKFKVPQLIGEPTLSSVQNLPVLDFATTSSKQPDAKA